MPGHAETPWVPAARRAGRAARAMRDAITAKAEAWKDIVKIGRTHMQDATPLTLGQEWSGYGGMLTDDVERLESALAGVYRLALGGTAVGTGIYSAPRIAETAAAQIARPTCPPVVTAPNNVTILGVEYPPCPPSGTVLTL